jgi:acetyl esterase/lipase
MRLVALVIIVSLTIMAGGSLLETAAHSQVIDRSEPFREGLIQKRLQSQGQKRSVKKTDLVSRTFSYGSHSREAYDVYQPTKIIGNSSVIVMVHGGGWAFGDKASAGLVTNKAGHYLNQGKIFVSVNYPMVGDGHDPWKQAQSVAKAINHLRANLLSRGEVSHRIILIGHSAGAHLVSLIAAMPENFGLRGHIAGVVLLDSAGYNIPATMKSNPMQLYKNAFGADEKFWLKTSPIHNIGPNPIDMILICSSKRQRSVCDGARAFSNAILSKGAESTVMPVMMTHQQINEDLGLDNEMTNGVDRFIARRLKP